MPENENIPSPQDAADYEIDRKLREIDGNLQKMLLLAELSATDLDLDRDAMQKTVEHLKDKINRIADSLGQI
ncbi:MAG: hypothetical protein K2O18_11030 [Oscillospiraceae bacterium]|nr:hypothetical protein [Oscillospiraceae bacterium]